MGKGGKKSSTKLSPKSLSEKQTKAGRKKLTALLGQPVPQSKAGAALYLYSLLSHFRRLGNVSKMDAKAYRKIKRRLIVKLAATMKQLNIDPQDFGAQSLSAFAGRLVDSLVEFRFHQYSTKGLRKVRGNLFGRLFHDFAWHERKLRQLFDKLAGDARKELNRELKRPGTPGIVNADETVHESGPLKGMPVLPPLNGEFTRVRRATKIYAMVTNKKTGKLEAKEFMDGALVTFLNDDVHSAMCPVVTGEFKGIAASNGFGEQIGNAKNRFANLVELKMTVEGITGEVTVPRERLVFLAHGGDRLAVRPARTGQSMHDLHYTISTTQKGGFPEWYYRVSATIRSQSIYDLIDGITR